MRAKTAPRFPSVERCSFSYMFFVGLMETRYLTPWSGLRSMSRGESEVRNPKVEIRNPAKRDEGRNPKAERKKTSKCRTGPDVIKGPPLPNPLIQPRKRSGCRRRETEPIIS